MQLKRELIRWNMEIEIIFKNIGHLQNTLQQMSK